MRFDVPALPDEALAAAAEFHAKVLIQVEELAATLKSLLFRGKEGSAGSMANAASTDRPYPNPAPDGEGLTLVFADAPREHRAWRLAMVQSLARKHVPLRINALEGGDIAARGEASSWLESAEALTGQLIALD